MTLPKPLLKQHIWVLVCDGKKALLLQNAGDHVYPKLETRHVMEHSLPKSGDIASDAPGRAFSSAGTRRSAVDEGDPHLEDEIVFLRNVMDDVERRVSAGEIADLLLIAPPRALGIVRNMESKRLSKVTRAELSHDYVKLPLHEIEKHLQNI